ncbi:GIY-YIG nuclease family protein [Chromobacterium sphagni]|uniref:GIY-YIG nuclease family protein n=1 Tax=Chromobacterium sphagni TaxID=1903179 RepID=UPI000A99ACA2|nr:GIY-YIG nuclease family protein [Chromobacterium sphagni]
MSNPITYKNKTYSSLNALVESEASDGISYSLVATRIRDGWDLEKALCEQKNKNVSRTYIVGEKCYKNLKALAKEAEISYEAAVKRAHRGWADEEIFFGRKKNKTLKIVNVKKSRGKAVFVNGKEYENIREAFDSIKPGCTFNALRARIRSGWSIDEALEIKPKPDGRKNTNKVRMLNIDGDVLSAKGAAEKYNVPYSTILDRLNRGASPMQATGLQEIKDGDLLSQSEAYKNRRKIEKKTYVVDGVIYKSVVELARAYELPARLVYNRMRDNGWPPEQAVREEIAESVEINGKKYRSAMNAWEEIGKTNFTTYQSRKSQGLPLEVCLGLDPLPKLERYELNGVSYSSLNEIAAAFDLSVSQLTYRLNSMSLEQAVVYKPSNGRFSTSIFEKNPVLANSTGTLYFIKIALADGNLHKIGVTRKTTSQRFYSYDVEVICEVKGKICNLYKLEQLIISEFSELHYRAEDEFEGRTETFQLMDEEESCLLSFIQDNLSEFELFAN